MNKSDSRIYVGNLPQDIRTKDIEDLFYKFGKIKYVDLKNRKGPPFAFVEFEDARDAEDAIEERDGYNFEGHKLRVEFQKGSRNGPSGGGRGGGGAGGRGGGPPTRRSEYRCIITGLPTTGSWQDLKDHMREAGNVCYADVFKDGTGVVEFIRYEDMKYALKHLDDTKFRSHEGESSYIRVKSDASKRGRSTSRSRSRSPSRSSSRRHRKSGDRRSPSYSPERRSRSRDDDKRDRKRTKKSRTSSPSSSRSRSASHSRSNSRRRNRSYTKSKSKSRSRSRSPRSNKRRTNNNNRSSKSASKSRSRSPSPSHAKDGSKSPQSKQDSAKESINNAQHLNGNSDNGDAAADQVKVGLNGDDDAESVENGFGSNGANNNHHDSIDKDEKHSTNGDANEHEDSAENHQDEEPGSESKIEEDDQE